MSQRWAVYIRGPEQLLAFPTREDAQRYAERINRAWVGYAEWADLNPKEPAWTADVVPWEGTADEHAHALNRVLYGSGR